MSNLKFIYHIYLKIINNLERQLVKWLFIIMRKIHSSPSLIETNEKIAELKNKGIVIFDPNDEVKNFLARQDLDRLFEDAKLISSQPPVRQYVLSAHEIEVFSYMINEEISSTLQAVFLNNFLCIHSYLLEYLPYAGDVTSSHIWHTDDYVQEVNHHKLIFYLSDCNELNGAFEYFQNIETDILIKGGFKSSYEERSNQNPKVTKLLQGQLNKKIAQGLVGTAFLFNPSKIVHRGGNRLLSPRRAIVFELIPGQKNSRYYREESYIGLGAIAKIRPAIKHWFQK